LSVAAGLPAQRGPDPILCWASRNFGTNPRLVVDLRLRSEDARRPPSADDVRAVTVAGGTVLYRFNVAVLRADLDTAALRQLLDTRNGIADVAYPVGDLSRFDVLVQIFFRSDVRPADDSALAALARKPFSIPSPPKPRVVSITLADSLIPEARRLRGVSSVRAQAMVCAVTTGGNPSTLPR
jgi:hypothetical protein